ncbi:MAG: cytochrome c [Candidatus Eremiobacteraeota bacterium]|nr:cytochrome c [Candidatus Eremiobacteraeota bacterium]
MANSLVGVLNFWHAKGNCLSFPGRLLSRSSTPSASPAGLKPGQAAFESTCAACHQASGMGVPGTFPPLAGSEWVNGAPEVPIAVVLRGVQGAFKVAGMNYSGSMPSHRDTLKDDQIAEILTYVRSSWGNSAAP